MKKIILLFLLLIPINVIALEYPELHYKNITIYDLTDKKVLYEKNSNEQQAIASLTKLMTIITAIEKIDDTTKTITYTQEMKNNVAYYASIAGLEVGKTYTFEDLLYGAMLPSGADATVALAYSSSGSLDNFIKAMNELAQKIGMNNSNFVNVHGLDEDNHYSTAEDIKKLLEYSLNNELFKKVYTTKEYTMSNGKKLQSTVLKQGIKYNLDTSKILGSKTGFTANAGLCISALMEDESHEILIITLGAPSNENHPYNITDAIELINYTELSNNYETIIVPNEYTKNIQVNLSTSDIFSISSTKEISLYLPKDYNKNDIKIEYNGPTSLSYKDKKGTQIGEINYYYQDTLIDNEPVYLNTQFSPSYKKLLIYYQDKLIIALISVILIILVPILLVIIKSEKSHK
ncbi:MAG: D-alanyl-D-alanine carboxypeptidase family protein [Candidatus Coprovivens sp.]